MQEIDHIILRHSKRGMETIYALNNKPLTLPAAEAFIPLIQKEKKIFIYTGFYVNGAGETDGPVGAKVLYDAMKTLSLSPLIITDTSCTNYFTGMDAVIINYGGGSDSQFKKLLREEQPIAHISIERLSANREGRYCNCSGKDITAFSPPLDRLFAMAGLPEFAVSSFASTSAPTFAPTFAIGDGGNEIGMGNFADLIEKHLHFSPAQTTCDYPILSTVSNWGAYGFLAAIQKILQKKSGRKNIPKLLPQFSEVEEFLCHIVSCGATDGISGRNEMSVDGNDYRLDDEILSALEDFLTE